MSAQYCGCDEEAKWTCEQHRKTVEPKPVVVMESQTQAVPVVGSLNAMIHPLGGGPTRATTLPEGASERKSYPIATGFMDYFPDAIAAISHLSWKGNQQHNLGGEVYWNRAKSQDEADTMLRHFLQRGTVDTDGVRHSVKMAWRALALLQKELEG